MLCSTLNVYKEDDTAQLIQAAVVLALCCFAVTVVEFWRGTLPMQQPQQLQIIDKIDVKGHDKQTMFRLIYTTACVGHAAATQNLLPERGDVISLPACLP